MKSTSHDTWDLADTLLTPDQRTVLWLRYAEDLSPAQIAHVMDCSPVRVRVMLLRSRARLRDALQQSVNASSERRHPHAQPA